MTSIDNNNKKKSSRTCNCTNHILFLWTKVFLMFLFNFLLHCLHSLHNLFPLHPFPSRLSCLLCLRILLQFVFSFMLMTQNTNDTEGSCRLKENSVLFFLASLYPQMPLVCLSPFPTSSFSLPPHLHSPFHPFLFT